MGPASQNELQQSQELSAEEARQALIELVERSDKSELKVSHQHLRADPAVERENGVVEIGTWRCNLKTRKFDGGIITHEIFAHFQGKFSVAPDGKWRAEITEEKHN